MKYPSDQLRRVLFVDIETAAFHKTYDAMSEKMQHHWQKKARRLINAEEYPAFEEEFAALYHDKAAIYAEFARVICISVGFIHDSENQVENGSETGNPGMTFKVKSFYGDDEQALLNNFHQLLNEFYYDRFNQFICGHNLKEFDIPFLCRRSMVNQLKLPNLMDIAGYKPWQVHHLLDTMEMWKYGDYKHYTSLDLLCTVLGVDTPKSDLDGSQVNKAYWNGELQRIVTYCQNDVVATARVYLKCVGLQTFDDTAVVIVS